jgi:hypothetical protein
MTRRASDRPRQSAPILALHLGATNLGKGHKWQDIAMGRPASPNLPVRGGDRSALSDQKMVLPQGLGDEARKADRNEEGEGRHCPQDRRHPSLHLGRRHVVRLGPRQAGMNRS